MIRMNSLVAGLLALAVLPISGCGKPSIQGTAVTGVTVVDAQQGAIADQTVIFEGDRIISISPSDEAPAATKTIDGRGKFLIPGLWDMHVHLTYDRRFTELMPMAFLNYGVTSVRDTGGMLEKMLPVVERMREPDAVAPRVFFSGPLLDGEHVVYDGRAVPELGVRNENVDVARQNVERLKRAGADFVKIYEMVSPEVFTTISGTARQLDLPVAAHVPLSMTASSAAPHVDSLEHIRNIEFDCAGNSGDLLKSRTEALQNHEDASGLRLRGSIHALQRPAAIAAIDETRCGEVLATLTDVIQVPTTRLNALTLFPVWERDDWADAVTKMPADIQAEWADPPSWFNPDPEQRDTRFAEYTLDMIERMMKARVPVGAGTDTPIAHAIPGYSLHTELEMLVRAGLTPLEALNSATVRPAEFFSLQSEMGTIEVGMRADMVLLNANPLADIRNTRSIHTVIFRGRILDQETVTTNAPSATH